MISEKQRKEKLLKVLEVTRAFLKGNTIEEVANITGISSSSVQRYLNEKEYIDEACGFGVYEVIQEKLKRNKQEGLSKGGKVSQERYTYGREEDGKFTSEIKKR